MIQHPRSADDVIAALMFPPKSAQNIDFMRQQYASAQQLLDPAARAFAQQAYVAFEDNHSQAAQNRQRLIQLEYQGNGLGTQSVILPVATLQEFCSTTPYMQNWIMAHPVVAQLHVDQRMHGYQDTYVSPCPDLVGIHNPYYRAVTNGMHVDLGDTSVLQIHYEDDPIAISEADRLMVLDTWQAVQYHLDEKEADPTHPGGDPMI